MDNLQESDAHSFEEITIRPVGYVRSRLKAPSLKTKKGDIELSRRLEDAAKEAKHIRSLVSELVINPELDGIMDGLEDFSHALVLYWPHLQKSKGRYLIKVHPMGIKEFPLKGIFSTCSPARPNPVLVTAVEIMEKRDNILKVRGLEAVDGSPVIDIKPYTMTYYSVKDIKVSEWMKQIQDLLSRV